MTQSLPHLDPEGKASIRAEIEQMRNLGLKRQELSLHACRRLFFDLGQKPSTALVRELTGVGSASDIPRDIELFWTRLRETASARAAIGRIPPKLEEAAGQLLGQLFDSALEAARLHVDTEKAQVAAKLSEAGELERIAQAREESAKSEIERIRGELQQTALKERQVSEALLIERHKAAGSVAEISAVRGQMESLRAELVAKERSIENLNQQLIATVERCTADVKDANADAERRIRPLLVELDSLRSARAQQPAGARPDFDLIQQMSGLKRTVDSLQAANRDLESELERTREALDSAGKASTFSSELASFVLTLASAGRLNEDEVARLAPYLSDRVTAPESCPSCGEVPELFAVDGAFELSCTGCSRESGVQPSRLAALVKFCHPVLSIG